MKKIAVVLFMLSLAACKTRPIQPTYSQQTFPSVGSTETVSIGDHLITQGDALTATAIVIPQDIVFGDTTIKQGKYRLASENDEYRLFRDVNFTKGNRTSGRGKVFLFKKDASTKLVCLSRQVCTESNYSMGSVTTYSRANTQQTLIYSGKIGNRVTLGYREFKDDIARPAFSNNVDYDLSESKILGYKGARLEVINASNTEITYKVVTGFN